MKKFLIILTIFLTLGLTATAKGATIKPIDNVFKGELIQKEFPKVKTTKNFLKEIEDYKEELRIKEEKRKQEEKQRLLEAQRREQEKKEKERIKKIKAQQRQGRQVKLQISFYCQCELCCGSNYYTNRGITASGTRAKWGTVAMPNNFPFGTKLKIQGFGNTVFTCEDRVGAIYNLNDGTIRVDIFVNSHSQALSMGRKNTIGWIIN